MLGLGVVGVRLLQVHTSLSVGVLVSGLALLVIGWMIPLFALTSRRGRAAVEACVREGRCPVCLYDLRGLPEDEDGCTVCPECGAAWRVETRARLWGEGR